MLFLTLFQVSVCGAFNYHSVTNGLPEYSSKLVRRLLSSSTGSGFSESQIVARSGPESDRHTQNKRNVRNTTISDDINQVPGSNSSRKRFPEGKIPVYTRDGGFWADIIINNVTIEFLVDTGSCSSSLRDGGVIGSREADPPKLFVANSSEFRDYVQEANPGGFRPKAYFNDGGSLEYHHLMEADVTARPSGLQGKDAPKFKASFGIFDGTGPYAFANEAAGNLGLGLLSDAAREQLTSPPKSGEAEKSEGRYIPISVLA